MANISYNNPGTQNTGQGGARLADFLMQLSDRESKITNAGRSAEYLRQTLDNPETDSGITDDHWKNMGNQDKAAWAQGYQDKQTIGRVKALTQNLVAQAQQRQQQTTDDDAASNVFGSLARRISQTPQDPLTDQPMTGDPDTSGLINGMSPTQRALVNAMGKAGPMNPRATGAMVTPLFKSLLGQGKPDATLTPNYIQDPKTGMRTLLYGKQAIPSGTDPDLAGQTVDVTDDDGNVIGQGLPGRGGLKLIPANKNVMTDAQRQNLILQHQKAKEGLLMALPAANGDPDILKSIKSSIADHDTAIQGLQTPAGPPSKDATPKYNSAADVQAAYKAGTLDKSTAAGILQSQFGMQ